MQVVANFKFEDNIASFRADVDDMTKAAAERLNDAIMHMALPNQGRVSSCTFADGTCFPMACCTSICTDQSVSSCSEKVDDTSWSMHMARSLIPSGDRELERGYLSCLLRRSQVLGVE